MSTKPCCAKYNPVREPRTSCDQCWRQYFLHHYGRVAAVQAVIEKFGRDRVVSSLGTKFVQRLERFLHA